MTKSAAMIDDAASVCPPGAGEPVVVWHCGFQKTATTTMQSILAANRTRLSPYCTVLAKGSHTRALRSAAILYWRNGKQKHRERFEEEARFLVTRIRESGADRALVSDENILSEEIFGEHFDVLSFAREVLPILAEAALPMRSVFVIYTRDTERWLRSVHNQLVKARRCTLSWQDWRARVGFADEMEAHCADLKSSTGLDIRFLQLEDELSSKSFPGQSLLELCGIEAGVIDELEIVEMVANPSLPVGALEFMLEINRSELANRHLQPVRRTVLRNTNLFREDL